MRISVIGTGNIGSTLGRRWLQAGHEVVFGSRHPDAPDVAGAPARPVAQAIDGSEVVLLAVPGGAVADFLADHAGRLGDKVVIDATNDIGGASFDAHDAVEEAAPAARYARAFNTLGWENFAEPPADADLFYAADTDARDVVEELITAVGLRPVRIGDAGATGTVDALLPLWFALVKERGGNRKLALRVVD